MVKTDEMTVKDTDWLRLATHVLAKNIYYAYSPSFSIRTYSVFQINSDRVN